MNFNDFKNLAKSTNLGSWDWYCKLDKLGIKYHHQKEITKALDFNNEGFRTDIEFKKSYELFQKYKPMNQ